MINHNLSLEGVIAPIVTPVRGNGAADAIDFDGLAGFAEWLAEKGVDGIFVAGTTGRFSFFTPEQNAAACKAVSDAVGDRLTIYGGCCDSGRNRVLRNAELMKKAGADVMVTTAPYYLSCSIEEAEADLEIIADRSPLPVVLYNIPEFVGYGMRPEWLGEISGHPNVIGYKDSSNDILHHKEVLRLTGGNGLTGGNDLTGNNGLTGNNVFYTLIGKELLLLEAFEAGSSGLVLSFVNAFPELFVELYGAAKASDWEAAARLQAKAAEIVNDFLANRKSVFFSALMHYFEQKLCERGMKLKLI